jgi:FimV-like protein
MVAHKVKFVITLLTGFFAVVFTGFAIAVGPDKLEFGLPADDFLGPALGDYEYKVTDGDTLWNLSQKISTNGITIWQTMDAIYVGNPSAFLAADAGQLIVGSVVKLPTFNEVSLQTGNFVSEILGQEINTDTVLSDVEEGSSFIVGLEDHLVVDGDSLWNLSERLRPEGTTIRQTMDAIFIINPDAFLDQDASKIIINTLIKRPTFEQASVQTGRFVSDRLNRTVNLESLDAESDDDDRLPVIVVNSESTAIAIVRVDDSDQESDAYIVDENVLSAEESPAIPYRDEVNVSSLIEDISPVSEEQAGLPERTQIELDNEALRKEILLLTVKLEELSLSAMTKATDVGPAKSQRDKSNVVLTWIERQPWYVASLLASLMTMLGLFVYKTLSTAAFKGKAPSDKPYSSPKDSQFEISEIVFDETDGDIFAGPEVEPNLGGFDLMVDPVSEAEVHLSLGQSKEAIEVLEQARSANSHDITSRLKLLEIYHSEELTESIGGLIEEINSSGDELAIRRVELILSSGSQQGRNSLKVDEETSVLDDNVSAPIALDDAFADINEYFDADVLESINALASAETAELSDLEYLEEFQDINPVDIKLDLAATYADLGDKEGARAILGEILADASKSDKSRAQAILDRLDL